MLRTGANFLLANTDGGMALSGECFDSFCYKQARALLQTLASATRNEFKFDGGARALIFNDCTTLELNYFKAWFSGFVDGEGHFAAEKNHSKCVRCRLMINLRDDDTDSLIRIKEQFGGRVHPNSNHSCHFIVSDMKGCLSLVDHFDNYPLQSRKRYDYLIWKKIVLMVSRNEHRNGKREEVLGLLKLLREVREYRLGREKVFEKLLMGFEIDDS